MSHDDYPRRPASADRPPASAPPPPPAAPGRGLTQPHPLEEVVRLIERESPEPFYPAEFLQRTRADPERFDSLLARLATERLIEKVRGKSIESGAGVVLTAAGREVARDPALMDKLIRGDALREGDVGGTIRQNLREPVRPYLTYSLLALNVGVFLLGTSNPAWKAPAGATFQKLVATAPAVEAGEWWRLLSNNFLHFNWIHILFCMLSLHSAASMVEQGWGRGRMLVIYLAAAWSAGCVGVQHSGPEPLFGAWGVVCGLLSSTATWFLLYRKHVPADYARKGLFQVALSLTIIGVMGYMFREASSWGMLGGGIGGVAAALVMHVQRFGLPGMRKQAGMRWVVAVAMLTVLPMLSYLQMQRAWAGKGVMAKKRDKDKGGGRPDPEDKDGRVVKKDDGDDAKKEDRLLVRHVLRPPGDAAEALLITCQSVSLDPAKAKADAKKQVELLRGVGKHRDELKAHRAAVEKSRPTSKGSSVARQEALKLIGAALELCDVASAYLDEPTVGRKDALKEKFETIDEATTKYVDSLKGL